MPHKLLLADDSVTIQRVIELTFAEEDVEVVAVGDGLRAIERIKADPPDIVLADTGMPERDGYEVAAFVKMDPALSHIPVVLLTGAFEPLDEKRAQQVGCNGVLVKPFEPQLVISRVRELLASGLRPPGQESTTTPAQESPPVSPPPSSPPAPSADSFGLSGVATAELDDYFDQLDEAFASLDTARAASELGGAGAAETRLPAGFGASGDAMVGAGTAPGETDFGDWDIEPAFVPSPVPPASVPAVAGTTAAPAGGAASREAAPPLGAAESPHSNAAAAQGAPGPQTAAPTPIVLAASAEAAPLASAFAALLAVEQGAPAASASWPSEPPRAAITDELVAELTRRVLERLSDRAVRDAVAEVVTDVAERLVREEIERIKASIK